MPKNWARKMTVTPSNIAVPFWLAVAPMVRTKRDTRRGSLSCSSATFSEVGRVALDEAVEKAIRLASWVSRKKAIGFFLPSVASSDREDDEHLDAERQQHHADIGRQADQQVPAEQSGEVEHEAGDRDRRQLDDDHDQPHRHVEQALEAALQRRARWACRSAAGRCRRTGRRTSPTGSSCSSPSPRPGCWG